ncbi:MAG: isocitrate lyase/PEP mutase family protein [Pseudomonadota bacterium]
MVMERNRPTLKAMLAQPDACVLAPGVCDALSALLATRAGASCLYLSGASIAYTRLGQPDIGLVSMSEVADAVALIRDRVETPLIVDADTGYGNALNVQRTVRLFERVGAQAIQLEDQSLPKRCGHLAGKTLVSRAEMVGKVRAACDARANEATLIIARTDAIAVEGLEPALERAQAYLEAGADVLFIEAPRTHDEMRTVCETFAGRVPLLANMVEGGRTPLSHAHELAALGYRLVIYPGAYVRTIAHAGAAFYAALLAEGSTASPAMREAMFDFDGLNDVLGTSALLERGARYGETEDETSS